MKLTSMKKKSLAMLLTVCLMLTILPMNAAAEAAITTVNISNLAAGSGDGDDGNTWVYDSATTLLTIKADGVTLTGTNELSIVIASSVAAVTLDDVHITAPSNSTVADWQLKAIQQDSSSGLTVTLTGSSTLTGGGIAQTVPALVGLGCTNKTAPWSLQGTVFSQPLADLGNPARKAAAALMPWPLLCKAV